MEYFIENQSNLDKCFEPGSITRKDLIFRNLSGSSIKIFNFNTSVKISSCHHCKLIISAVSGLCEITDCHDCTISSASNEVLILNCKNLTLFIFTETDPVIKNSTNLKFAPFNIKFSGQDACFAEAELNSFKDKWSEVYDLNRNEIKCHYELMDPKEFIEESFEFNGFGEICNPVPRHAHYGGNLKYEIIPYSKSHSYTVERRDLPPTSKIIHSQFDMRKDVPYTRPIAKTDVEPNLDKDDKVMKKVIVKFDYLAGKGFNLKAGQIIIDSKECIEKCLIEFQRILDEFYEIQAEYLFAFFISIAAMLVCLLSLQLLRMTSEWFEASVACLVIILVTSELVIVFLLISRWKSVKLKYKLLVEEFNIRNSGKFAHIPAEFLGTLNYAEVYINETQTTPKVL